MATNVMQNLADAQRLGMLAGMKANGEIIRGPPNDVAGDFSMVDNPYPQQPDPGDWNGGPANPQMQQQMQHAAMQQPYAQMQAGAPGHGGHQLPPGGMPYGSPPQSNSVQPPAGPAGFAPMQGQQMVAIGPNGAPEGQMAMNPTGMMNDASNMQTMPQQMMTYLPAGYMMHPSGMMIMPQQMPNGQQGVQGPGMAPAGMQFVVVQQPGPGGMSQQMQQPGMQGTMPGHIPAGPGPGMPQQMQQPGMHGMPLAMPEGGNQMVMMTAPQSMPGHDLGKGAMHGVAPVDGMQDGKGAAARVAALSRSQQPKQGNNWRGADKQLGKPSFEQFGVGARPNGDLPLESMPPGSPTRQQGGSTTLEDSKLGKQMRKPQGKHWADFDAANGYDQDLKALCQDWSKTTGQDLAEPKAAREGGRNRKDGKAGSAAEEAPKTGKASQQQRQESQAAEKQWVAVRQAEQPLKGNTKGGHGRQDVATWQPVAAPKAPVPAPTQMQTVAAAQQLAAKGGRGAGAGAATSAASTTSGGAGGGGNGGGGKKSKEKKDQRMEDWFSARMAGHDATAAADAAASLSNSRGGEAGGYDIEEAGDDGDYGEAQESRSRGKRKGGKGAKSGKAEKSRDKGKGKSSGKGSRGYQSRSSW